MGSWAQPGRAQEPAEILSVTGRSAVASELGQLLRREPGRWPVAWSRARAAGPTLASVLWDKLLREGRPPRRLLWVGAHVAAAGASDGRLSGRWLAEAKQPEQLMALLGMVLAEGQPRPSDRVRALALESPSDAVRLAAALVLSRAEKSASLPATWLSGRRRQDPGLAAAALLSGARPATRVIDPWLVTSEPPGPEAQLVWRATLLARHPVTYAPQAVLGLAQQAMAWGSEAVRPTRLCAALQVGRAADPDRWLDGAVEPMPAESILLLGRSTAGGRTALRRGWLKAVPSSLVGPGLRRRLAVQFVRHATPAQITAAAPRWAAQEEIGDALCLSLAWRAAALGDLAAGPWLDSLRGHRASIWVRVALGEEIGSESLPEDEGSVLALAAAGRLPSAALARELERELWRRDSHPGSVAFDCWSSLVRDLLLSGSDYAQHADARAERFPYLARGLRRDDRRFFEVACLYLDWAVGDRLDVPESVRL